MIIIYFTKLLKQNYRDRFLRRVCINIRFSVSEPTTEILGGPELFIDQGSTINLTCLVQFAPEPPPTVGWTHEKQVSGTIYVVFSTTLTKKNGPFSDLVFEMIYILLHEFLFFFSVFIFAPECVRRFTAHKFRFSARRNKPGNGKRVDHQQQIINSEGVVFGYRLLLLRSVKCKFSLSQGSYIKRLVASYVILFQIHIYRIIV